jgi:hypothetical protein
MAATSAPAVKKALLVLFRGNSSLKGVQMEYAHPGAAIQQEAIYFHRTVITEQAAALGNLRRDEDYYIELIADVLQDGDDAQTPEERCWALVSTLETLVRENPGKGSDAMSGIVSGWVVWSGVEMLPAIEPGQRLAEATCRITVKHRK